MSFGHSNHNVTVSKPGVLNVFAESGLLHGTNKSTKTQGGEHGILAPALEGKPTQADITRRLAYLTKRQMEYDAYNARPRRSEAKSADDATELVRRLDSIMSGSELVKRTAAKVAMHEDTFRQKAHSRHFDWQKKVFEPINSKVLEAVDREFPKIHAERQGAMEQFLTATRSRGGVFLDDLVKENDYDPYSLNRDTTIRAKVKVQDPLKRVVEKTWEELELVSRETHRRARARDTLDPQQFTDMSMEATMTGHFEIKDLAGGVQMAFAGKDNESTVRLNMDFDGRPPLNPSTGRCDVVDSEFPRGKQISKVYRFTDTSSVIKLAAGTLGVYEPGERHAEPGGARLDTTRSDIMQSTKGVLPKEMLLTRGRRQKTSFS